MLAIELVGFPDKVRSALEIAINNRCRERFKVAGDRADILLIDVEGVGGPSATQRIASETNRHVVVVSDAVLPELGECQLTKPLSFARLVDLLDTLEPPSDSGETGPAVEDTSTSATSDLDAQRLAGVSRAQFQDSFVHLLSQVLSDIRLGDDRRIVEVAIRPGKFIQIDPRTERISTNLRNGMIRIIAGTPCSALDPTIRRLDETRLMGEPPHDAPKDLEELVWRILETGYRGRLLPSITLDTPIRLLAWPNLVRVTADSRQFALVSYWTRRRISVRAIASLFDLPVEDVAHVANFATIANLLDDGAAGDDRPLADPDSGGGVRRILRRIVETISQRAA